MKAKHPDWYDYLKTYNKEAIVREYIETVGLREASALFCTLLASHKGCSTFADKRDLAERWHMHRNTLANVRKRLESESLLIVTKRPKGRAYEWKLDLDEFVVQILTAKGIPFVRSDAHELPADAHEVPADAHEVPRHAHEVPANAHEVGRYINQSTKNEREHEPGYKRSPHATSQVSDSEGTKESLVASLEEKRAKALAHLMNAPLDELGLQVR